MDQCDICNDEWKLFEDWKFKIVITTKNEGLKFHYACSLDCLKILELLLDIRYHQKGDTNFIDYSAICCNNEHKKTFDSFEEFKDYLREDCYPTLWSSEPKTKLFV